MQSAYLNLMMAQLVENIRGEKMKLIQQNISIGTSKFDGLIMRHMVQKWNRQN